MAQSSRVRELREGAKAPVFQTKSTDQVLLVAAGCIAAAVLASVVSVYAAFHVGERGPVQVGKAKAGAAAASAKGRGERPQGSSEELVEISVE
jgi:hypothetical protein